MNKEEAIAVLIQAVRVAQQKGAFTLEDARVVIGAIQALDPKVLEPKVEEKVVEKEEINTKK